MLAVEPLRGSNGEEGALGSFLGGGGDETFLEDIDFRDLFVGFDVDGELELDPAEIFAVGSTAAEEPAAEGLVVEAVAVEGVKEAASQEFDKNCKPSPPAKCSPSQGKRKAKVDWTPELHRRFVEAVEQLGIDKAVPSRILELMGIDCLTRHNIASHLQKYRSHRKHLLAREAEAASWSQRRQIGGGAKKAVDITPWLAPTIGFPPPNPPPLTQLHVWGHPTVAEAPPMSTPPHVWLPHLSPPSPTPAQPWAAAPPPAEPAYWHRHYSRAVTQGTPCFPRPLPTPRFAGAAVAGIVPHHPIYRAIPPSPLALDQLANSELQSVAHPWAEERVDAAIEDVLAKPWLPLPLGLKTPAADSVLVELQNHGVSTVPPTRA